MSAWDLKCLWLYFLRMAQNAASLQEAAQYACKAAEVATALREVETE